MRTVGVSLVSVCALAGCAGSDSLVRVDPESPGGNCAEGGFVIYTGVDDNGDGVLQDEEVASDPMYVCNGAPGPEGPAGDDGEDGVDGDDGIDGMDGMDGTGGGLALGPVIEGNYTIDNTVDAALLAGVETITGDLTINSGVTTLDVPDLLEVYGTVYVYSATLETLSFGALGTVGGLEVAGTEVLYDLSGFSALTSAYSLNVTGNYVLESADLPGLAVGDAAVFYDNDALLSLSIDPVGSSAATYLEISGNDALDMCIADALLADLVAEGFTGKSYLDGGVACAAK